MDSKTILRAGLLHDAGTRGAPGEGGPAEGAASGRARYLMPRAVGADPAPTRGDPGGSARFLSRDDWDRPREGRPRYRGGGRGGTETSGTLVLGLLGVSIPGRCCGPALGAVRDASPCCRSSRSRLVSGREGVPDGSGARCAGLVGSGTPGRLRVSPGVACPGVLGSVPGMPGVPGVLGRGPGTPRDTRTPRGSSARLGECQGGRETEDRQRVCDGLGQWTEHRVSPLWVVSLNCRDELG